MALNKEVTFSFKEDVGGFISFKSYIPDWGASLNNRYYTFRFGEIWEHNIDTYEPITLIDSSSFINIEYVRTNVNGDLVYELTGAIQGLGLRTNDTLILELFGEGNGILFENVRATIPDPDIDGAQVILTNQDENLEGLGDSATKLTQIITMRRVNQALVDRNSFYDNLTNRGESFGSQVTFIINNDPSVIKEFKTLGYEGLGEWEFDVYSDIESKIINEDSIPKIYDSSTIAGKVLKNELQRREGKYFANIQGVETDVSNVDYNVNSVQGVGKGSPGRVAITELVDGVTIPVTGFINMDSIVGKDVRVGYDLYYFTNLTPDADTDNFNKLLKYAGKVEAVNGVEIRYNLNGRDEPSDGAFFLYSRNVRHEKSGVKGAFAHIIMSTDEKTHAEIFSVNSEVIISSQ